MAAPPDLSRMAGNPPASAGPDGENLQAGELEDLKSRMIEEMTAAWKGGRCLAVETLLQRCPKLLDRSEIAVQLIYEEVCLRQDLGQAVPTQEILDRFPEWRTQLEVLLECHRLLDGAPRAPVFPKVGEVIADFLLVQELGRGSLGRVFLASQPMLADRHVVLKVTPCEGQEHLSLARLQHTHVVPLYAAWDFPDKNLRVLCMPFLGGASLSQLLQVLEPVPVAQRTGRHLLECLNLAQSPTLITTPNDGPARRFLAHASYVETVCWIVASLADALQYTHERGLVHLDLKPSNVLLAADGQPMLLDFHLARQPINVGPASAEWLGGTSGFMSPEQAEAICALRAGGPILTAVDGRSDIYSLGLILCEALGGKVKILPPALRQMNPEVSVGLAGIVGKCLQKQPADRYDDASALAADLRRHLAAMPLRSVADRDGFERSRKWRHRRPQSLALSRLVLGILLTLVVAGAVLRAHLFATTRESQSLDSASRKIWGACHPILHGIGINVGPEIVLDHKTTSIHLAIPPLSSLVCR
jgi:serine/threonine protein kinase